jgi:hypothetical protein
MVIPIAVKNTMITIAHAQTTVNTTTASSSSNANATTYLTYKDNRGRFTINYPSGWNVTVAKIGSTRML